MPAAYQGAPPVPTSAPPFEAPAAYQGAPLVPTSAPPFETPGGYQSPPASAGPNAPGRRPAVAGRFAPGPVSPAPVNLARTAAPPNAPVTAPPNAPVTAPPNAPVTAPPNAPVTAPPNAPVTAPPNAPVTAPPNAPVTAPPNAPVTAPPFATTEPEPEPEPTGPDPEQILAAYPWRFDPETLREVVEGEEIDELREIRDLLTTKVNGVADNPSRARLLSLRAVVSRILGDLHKALADGKLAVAHAEATGELRRIAIAQARLANVLQWRGEYEEADRLFTMANSTELPDRLRAMMHQHAGKCAYDQDRYIEACNHFELALDLRKEEDPELLAQTELALDAVFRRVAEKGWGPYPRTKDEILKIRKPPMPAFDETSQRWGFTDADGTYVIGPGYLDVQPFRDGAAWVQRHGSRTWELIDETGQSLIDPSAGYLGVGSFSDGLAWVSRDGTSRWIAIDKSNTVLISTGFDDVRPFRRGLAAVRRGGRWGAVDGVGRVVVSFHYDGFATALYDGRYIDGFSDEGLAVVSVSGRKGVVDRSGHVVVAPAYPVLVIHPVAFLVVNETQQWGALDRHGRPLVDPTFPSRTALVEEIDRLLVDTRPML